MKTLKLGKWKDPPENYTGIIEYPSGNRYYYLNGKRHREDGPAIIQCDGTIDYYLNGKLHREDGPAIILTDGTVFYYINDKEITKEVNIWIKENNIPDYRLWNEADKKLFRKTFCYNVTKLERSVEQKSTEEKMKTLKLDNFYDLPENYTGIVKYHGGSIEIEYYLNGEFHREDGPAIIWYDGSIYYYVNGVRHREDGPAVIWDDGSKYWYINSKDITKEVNNWIKENNIPDYRLWNEADKKLFRETFCYNVTKLERSIEQKMKTIKINYWKEITKEVNIWIKENNIPDYRVWNESVKKLFRKIF